MRTNRIIIICGIILVAIVVIVKYSHTKTAGWYLDHIVELRQEKQDLLDKVSDIDKQILEYRKVMDEKQFTGLNYMGLTQETVSPQRTGTETKQLSNRIIE